HILGACPLTDARIMYGNIYTTHPRPGRLAGALKPRSIFHIHKEHDMPAPARGIYTVETSPPPRRQYELGPLGRPLLRHGFTYTGTGTRNPDNLVLHDEKIAKREARSEKQEQYPSHANLLAGEGLGVREVPVGGRGARGEADLYDF